VKKATGILFALLRAGLAIGVLVYLAASGAINWSAFRGLVAVWPVTLAAFALLLIDMCVTAWRLCVLMKPRGLRMSLASSVRLSLMGNFFNACLPGATSGDVVKIYYASEGNRGRRTELAAIILLDRAVGMFALVILPLLAAPFFSGLVSSSAVFQGLLCAAAAVATVMLAVMLVSSSTRVRSSRIVSWAVRKLPLGRHVEKVFETLRVYRHNKRTLFASVMISLMAHSMTIGVILLIAQATNPAAFSWQMSILAPLGFLANTLPLTPGGLGVGETAFNKLFGIAGLTGGAELLLGWRLLTILSGLIGLVFYLQGRKHLVHAALPSLEAKEELSFT
jgi:uncharacterized protein (TIRG00374 family)